MVVLIAEGDGPGQSWTKEIPEGAEVCIGRSPPSGWAVPWDRLISREHVLVCWGRSGLSVRRLDTARNPLFCDGAEVDQVLLRPGQHFVLGSTRFQLVERSVGEQASRPPARERSFAPGDLQRTQFHDADQRLEVLSRLPQLIANSHDENEFLIRLVNLLLAGIPGAEAAAVVRVSGAATELEIMQWDRRKDAKGQFKPSRKLVTDSLRNQRSILHSWDGPLDSTYTVAADLDWAFCAPIPGPACQGWALYVTGQTGGEDGANPSEEPFIGDLRFVELFAEMMGALRQAKQLQGRQAKLSQFFSPTVLAAIEKEGTDEFLEPKEAQVSVLFCDLRGFAKEAEHYRDNLSALLNRVGEALSVMTRHILVHGGVIGDVQGDAAMGFWGWPLPSDDGPLKACQAALDILRAFRSEDPRKNTSLHDFRVGIGIAHGFAVAGRIGTADHVKVTVFGPVVNLASRLEGMTKLIRVPILIDEAVADRVRNGMAPADGRCRRLGKMLPYGTETPLMVSELLASEKDGGLSGEDVRNHEAAVEALVDGDWPKSLDLLHRLPAQDRAKDFLTVFIHRHNYEPPPNWDGIIRMPSK